MTCIVSNWHLRLFTGGPKVTAKSVGEVVRKEVV